MMKRFGKLGFALVLAIVGLLFFGGLHLSGNNTQTAANPQNVYVPQTGKNNKVSGNSEIDFSNAASGYVMARFSRKSDDVRVLIDNPGGVQYQYNLNTENRWEVFPLTGGNGKYVVRVVERAANGRFAVVGTVNLDVVLESEFAPFLRPNQFVNFGPDSKVVAKAAELTKNSKNVLESVTLVFDFVVANISYDRKLADDVTAGRVTTHIPDVDKVLERGLGICFDYAALMAAMLRSQGIPTQLVVGYAGLPNGATVRHAWISVHTPENGWVSDIIYFDGEEWHLMDPTFVSTGNQADVMNFIGGGDQHTATNLH
jgi:hypothetical protein